ncbi:hypothetical protein FG486_06190 [Sphingomonas ursincola]|uniref:Lipopolysaccharide biosynthesis protein n=2 Tax=Sphingomonas ursincola TaxID=56361 RepID=A0A7V8RCF9_9SPHN|nr:hypothetical protein [Sphingomonas ursincola]
MIPLPNARAKLRRGENVPPNAERPKANLGAAMLSMTSLLRVAVQLAAIPLLARILGPYPYGVMAIAMPIANTLASICDFGLSSIIIRYSDRIYENTGFWIAAAVTSITLTALAITSYFLGAFVHPDTGRALIALGMMLPLSCFMSIPIARLTRNRRLGIIALGDGLGITLGLVAALYFAVNNFGFWSLVIQQLVILFMRAAIYISFSGFWPRLSINTRLASLLISEGARVTGSNLFETAARTVDNMLTGILLGPRPAGAYTMAFQFARLPEMVLGGPLSMSIMGKAAAVHETKPDAKEIYCSHLRGLAFIVVPAMTGLAAISDDFTEVILGPQWSGTGSILRGLCGAGAFLALGTVNQAALTSLGAYKDRLILSMILLIGVLAAVALGSLFDVIYLSYFISVAYFCQFLVGVRLVSRRSAAAILPTALDLTITALSSALMFICITVLQASAMLKTTPIFDLSVAIPFGVATFLITSLILRGRSFFNQVANLKNLFSS